MRAGRYADRRDTALTLPPGPRRLMPGLEDLYREIILDHYRSPRNRGELASPPAQRVGGLQSPVR